MKGTTECDENRKKSDTIVISLSNCCPKNELLCFLNFLCICVELSRTQWLKRWGTVQHATSIAELTLPINAWLVYPKSKAPNPTYLGLLIGEWIACYCACVEFTNPNHLEFAVASLQFLCVIRWSETNCWLASCAFSMLFRLLVISYDCPYIGRNRQKRKWLV